MQRKAEVIRERLAADLGEVLAPRRLDLSGGGSVQVDAASANGQILAEIFARQGALKPGQQKKVAIDTLKLITIQREHPDARLVLAFADDAAAAYALGSGWLACALRTWKVEVRVVEIREPLREEIRAAQAGQRMVNADEVADDVVVDAEA